MEILTGVLRGKTARDEAFESSRDRRSFIRSIALGTLGAALGGVSLRREASSLTHVSSDRARVSFVTGGDRRENVRRALEPFRNEIAEDIAGKRVLVKANLVDPIIELAAVHVDAVRGVLDFLTPIYGKRILVGDSNGRPGGTMESLRNHGYFALEKEYRVKVVDLNDSPTTVRWIMGAQGRPLDIEIIDTFLDPDVFIISLTRPKTHGNAVVTLSVKNIVMGSPVNVITRNNRLSRGQKTKMHAAGDKGLNLNLFRMALDIRPGLSVIDGLVGMEGNGPSRGTAVEHGFALAGRDMLAVDRVAVELMGVPFGDIGYLNYLAWAGEGQADLDRIDILGPAIGPHVIPYRLHDNIERQLAWKDGLVVDPR